MSTTSLKAYYDEQYGEIILTVLGSLRPPNMALDRVKARILEQHDEVFQWALTRSEWQELADQGDVDRFLELAHVTLHSPDIQTDEFVAREIRIEEAPDPEHVSLDDLYRLPGQCSKGWIHQRGDYFTTVHGGEGPLWDPQMLPDGWAYQPYLYREWDRKNQHRFAEEAMAP